MAAKPNALLNKRKMALTQARLKAWWDGATFDPAAAEAAFEAKLAQAASDAANDTGVEDELFDAPEIELSPRLRALSVIWGEGRVRPGDPTAEALEPARLGVEKDSVLGFLSPGLSAPVVAVAGAHAGKIEVLEWREETFAVLQHGLDKAKLTERVNAQRIDLEAHAFAADAFDGLISVDDFVYCGYPPQLAQQIFKGLKPGACAVIETYVGQQAPVLASAFASAFAEPQVRGQSELLRVFTEAGFVVEADECLTEEFVSLAKQGFKRLSESLAKSGELNVAAAQELAWEAETWRVRIRLLVHKRLERRRFVLRKPGA